MRAGACLVIAACYANNHVDIAPLPPDPSPHDRLEAFERYRPGGAVTEQRCQYGSCTDPELHSLKLGDGAWIQDADDLLPLVDDNSATGQEARAAARDREKRHTWALAIPLTFAAGVGGIALGDHLNNGDLKGGGLLLALGGPLVCFITAGVYNDRAHRHDRAAFQGYERDLGTHLRVCADGLQIVPCEGGAPLAPVDPGLKQLRPVPSR